MSWEALSQINVHQFTRNHTIKFNATCANLGKVYQASSTLTQEITVPLTFKRTCLLRSNAKMRGSKDHKIRNFFDQHKLMENEGTVILVYIYQVS